MMEWTKTRFTARMMNMWPQIRKLKSMKHAAMIVHPYHVASISKASQNSLFFLCWISLRLGKVS